MTDFYKQVAELQNKLKAPKGQFNKFGNYKYRSCEDILEAVKQVKGNLVVTISDTIEAVGNRIYVKATATITDGTNSLSNTAFAREADNKKGMDESQITGAASSYARKYALNGLFCIDDTKDADTMDNSQPKQKPAVTKDSDMWERAKAVYIRDGNFAKVLQHATISQADQKLMIEEIEREYHAQAQSDNAPE